MSPLRHREKGRRHAFTLVELLVVVLIIAILATVVLFTYLGAVEIGKEARTRAQIAKIDSFIMTMWEGFRTRRVPLRISRKLSSFEVVLDA